jgi:hypothetical protein
VVDLSRVDGLAIDRLDMLVDDGLDNILDRLDDIDGLDVSAGVDNSRVDLRYGGLDDIALAGAAALALVRGDRNPLSRLDHLGWCRFNNLGCDNFSGSGFSHFNWRSAGCGSARCRRARCGATTRRRSARAGWRSTRCRGSDGGLDNIGAGGNYRATAARLRTISARCRERIRARNCAWRRAWRRARGRVARATNRGTEVVRGSRASEAAEGDDGNDKGVADSHLHLESVGSDA